MRPFRAAPWLLALTVSSWASAQSAQPAAPHAPSGAKAASASPPAAPALEAGPSEVAQNSESSGRETGTSAAPPAEAGAMAPAGSVGDVAAVGDSNTSSPAAASQSASAPASQSVSVPAAPVPPPPTPAPAPASASAGAKREGPSAFAANDFERVRSPLTLEGGLGVSARPASSLDFASESVVGTMLLFSAYAELSRKFAVGLEVEHTSLGKGQDASGPSSLDASYAVNSLWAGARAFPYRRPAFDLFVGLRVGAGLQSVSANGTAPSGSPLNPPRVFSCKETDSPAFELGGGVGARLMLASQVGLSLRLDAAGRRLTSDVVDDCGPGLGSVTTFGATLGLGYDIGL